VLLLLQLLARHSIIDVALRARCCFCDAMIHSHMTYTQDSPSAAAAAAAAAAAVHDHTLCFAKRTPPLCIDEFTVTCITLSRRRGPDAARRAPVQPTTRTALLLLLLRSTYVIRQAACPW
jgi:hypothetical protein